MQEVKIELPDDEMRLKFEANESIVFASSSGHCNLDCSYCVVEPVIKHKPSLTYDDLRFVQDRLGGRVFFIFSGRGDFFAGYRKSERLLARLLEHEDVAVALDVNGVAIHEFLELTREQLTRIRHINLTFHYRQLIDHRALGTWHRNALAMLDAADGDDFFVNYILSPPERELWESGLSWYRENIFDVCGKQLVLINNVNLPLSGDDEAFVAALRERYGSMIRSLRIGNFESILKEFTQVSCPAGQTYLRVWNDGQIDACPNLVPLQNIGNAKERRLDLRTEPFYCSDVRHCDCYHLASAGKLTYFRNVSSDTRSAPLPPARGGGRVLAWLRQVVPR
ncbi:MAG: radical SAM protein [Thiomonas arsenitoxydans]|nr:radical SAM protein [Thiomonas arsenitoxydans]CQR42661.1 conserved hypothetical protein [Thiomonas sp. CB3]